MSLISRTPNPVLNHLNRASLRKQSGIYTVTQQTRSANAQKRESPFPPMVYGPDAGTPQTAYKPILRLS